MPSTTTPLEAERALVAKLRAEKESIRADYEELRLTCTDLKEVCCVCVGRELSVGGGRPAAA